MKKTLIHAIIALLLLSSKAIIPSDKPNPKDNQTQETTCQFDEFDALVETAIESSILKKEIEFPKVSKFQQLIRKIGVTLFLAPYMFLATRYQAVKKWMRQYIKKTWKKKDRKKTENKVDGQKQ